MSACESAEQQSPDGGEGFGSVTEGLHAIRPLRETLQMVWASMVEAEIARRRRRRRRRGKAVSLCCDPISVITKLWFFSGLGYGGLSWIYSGKRNDEKEMPAKGCSVGIN